MKNNNNKNTNNLDFLKKAIIDLLDGSYNLGDNNTGLSDDRFQELLDLKDALLAENNI